MTPQEINIARCAVETIEARDAIIFAQALVQGVSHCGAAWAQPI